MRVDKKRKLWKSRHNRVRRKISGTNARPRMSVKFTGQHIYVQFIDDETGVTLASASTRHKSTPDREKLAANVKSAEVVGSIAAEAAKKVGIETVVFDRGGNRFHGKVKALAEAARGAGIKF